MSNHINPNDYCHRCGLILPYCDCLAGPVYYVRPRFKVRATAEGWVFMVPDSHWPAMRINYDGTKDMCCEYYLRINQKLI